MTMTEKHERLRDDVAALAVGVLEPIERTWTEGHLRRCATCSERLEEYRTILGLLPRALPEETPAADGLAALLSEARRSGRRAARARQPEMTATWGWLPRIRPARWATAVACVGLLAWNLALHRQLGQMASQSAPVPVEQLARLPDGRMVALIGTGTPGAAARLYVAEDGQQGELAIAGLPALPPGRVYQLWFARGAGAPLSGGVFRVDRRYPGGARARPGRGRDRGARAG
jgi:anti-sigma-K factor RskA